jgi:hypothetical protein
MMKIKFVGAVLAATMIAALAGTISQKASSIQTRVLEAGSRTQFSETPNETNGALDPISSTSTFYAVRSDLRRCAAPLCGGYFVKRVNLPNTRCANGSFMAECYVAGIDWNGQPQVEARRALLRGNLVAHRHHRFGQMGTLRVTESWQAASDHAVSGSFYRVRDRGLRCITFPCPTHHEAKLNSTVSRNIAGVDLTGVAAPENAVSEASTAMTGSDGVLVAGFHAVITGPGGKSETLKANQFYLRGGQVQASKPCLKTGCGNQLCADHDVISTCEWRPEYACYQKAACERQADGNCGFTKTTELVECLARARR